MRDFLKVTLRGLITLLLLPFIVAFLALYAVYNLLVYIIVLFRNLIIFFMGGNTNTLKEDIIAKEKMEAEANKEQNLTEAISGLMHDAIRQNPEAVRAMAQQEINTQQAKAIDATIQPSPEQIKTIDVVQEQVVVEETKEEVKEDKTND